MRELTKEEADEKCEFMYIECDCGFHLGLDATYILQVADIMIVCPSCLKEINTEVLENSILGS